MAFIGLYHKFHGVEKHMLGVELDENVASSMCFRYPLDFMEDD